MDNQTLLQKADLALSDLTGSGGYLNPEMADTFLRTIIDSPTIINSCRVVTMNAPIRKINKIGFGSRILKPAVSATALSSGDRSKPDLSQVTLTTSEVIAEVRVPYEVMEDNIERATVATNGPSNESVGGLHSTLVTLIGERAALDLEELAIQGDPLSADAYLQLQSGFLKLATSHVVSAGGATITKNLLKSGVKAMPDKYLRNRAQMVHYVSVDNDTEYRDTYANRATALGDNMLTGLGPVYAWGSQLQGVPLMPNASGLYTNPLNLIMGIQRQISMEFDKDITARVYIIVLTARVAFAIEEVDAVVKYTTIG